MVNHCGTCTACCKVFDIAELKKPAGKWCDHCHVGVGCKIYEQRPSPCVDFECLWLLSQKRDQENVRLPVELRPDRCKVVFGPSTNPDIMAATTMPGSPDAWRKPLVADVIKKMVRGGFSVVVGGPGDTRRTMISRSGVREVRMTEPDEHGMQYNIPEPKEQRP